MSRNYLIRSKAIMKFKKIALSLIAQTFVLGGLVFAGLNRGTTPVSKVNADGDPTPLLRNHVSATENSHTRSGSWETFSFRFAASYTSRANKYDQVYLSTLDPTFIESEQTQHSKPEEIPHYDGFVSSIKGKGEVATDSTHGNKSLLVIPRGVQVTTRYIFDTKTINTGAMGSNEETGNVQYGYIFGVFIPNTVTTIEADAFKNVPSTVTMYCESASKPAGWDSNWTDAANIVWGVDVQSDEGFNLFKETFSSDVSTKDDIEKEVLLRRSTLTEEVPTGYSYSLGFKSTVNFKRVDPLDPTKLVDVSETYDKPLTVEYTLTNKDGSEVAGTPVVLDITNADRGFDGVGFVVGSIETNLTFTIPVAKGQTVDSASLVFKNIFTIGRARDAKRIGEGGVIEDDLGAPLTPYVDLGEYSLTPSNTVTTIISLADLTEFSVKPFSTFAGFTQVNFEMSNKAAFALGKYNPAYADYRAQIARGEYYVRFRFVGLFDSHLEIKLKGDATPHRVLLDTPTQYDYLIVGTKAKGNPVGFLFKNTDVCANFDPNQIESIKFLNMCLRAEVVKNDPNASKAVVYTQATFAVVDMFNVATDGASPVTNLLVVLAIVAGAYVVLFAAGSVGLYFYLKNKYKNDEFRRMNTKKYIGKAIKNFFEFFVVTLAITFIVFRTAILNSRVVMYNPLDPYVIVFSVVALIFIGLTIKDVVVATKQSLENKKKRKLHIGDDKVEDGTN